MPVSHLDDPSPACGGGQPPKAAGGGKLDGAQLKSETNCLIEDKSLARPHPISGLPEIGTLSAQVGQASTCGASLRSATLPRFAEEGSTAHSAHAIALWSQREA